MRVLAVVPSVYDTSPGQRFRIEQWEPLLAEGGVEITYAPFESPELRSVLYQSGHVAAKIGAVIEGMKRRSRELDSVGDFDLVYLFREAALLGPPWFERKIKRSGIPIVFDFDDAIFVSYKSPSNGYLSYLKFPAKTAEICRMATHIMAGNQYLADFATEHNPNVTVIPSTIDTEKYVPTDRPVTDIVTIGWSGSYSTVQHLDTIGDVLLQLAETVDFRLRVIGPATYDLPGLDVICTPWQATTEVSDLRSIDIGIMPLPDDKWTRGKCGFKALQYMALGIPAVCSPVGVNSTIIKDGENGFLANAATEWIEKIRMLMHSAELRQKLGKAGRRTVEHDYSAKVIAPKVLQVFRAAVEANS